MHISWKTSFKRWRNFAPLLLLLLLNGSGCTTRELWTDESLDSWNQPADNPHLRVFEPAKHVDFLVAYDEYSERKDKVRRREYWLKENLTRVKQRRHPHFVKSSVTLNLTPLPVYRETAVPAIAPDIHYAVLSANNQSFTLHTEGMDPGPFMLPFYKDRFGELLRVALTPVTVAVDATVVGGVVGYFVLVGMAQSAADAP